MAKNAYTYIEDSAGGLHLFVLRNGRVVDGITNLEYAPAGEWDSVKDDINNDPVEAVHTWEGHMRDYGIDVEAFYHYLLASGPGGGAKVVADDVGIYIHKMGRAALRYFGIGNID
jgi:hypothetical protein